MISVYLTREKWTNTLTISIFPKDVEILKAGPLPNLAFIFCVF